MNAKQNKRLSDIEARLMDVFLDEADPDRWAQVDPETSKEQQQKARGNRYWQCKVANQTISLLTRIETYRVRLKESREGTGPVPDDERKHAADIKEAEKKVNARLSLVKKRAV